MFEKPVCDELKFICDVLAESDRFREVAAVRREVLEIEKKVDKEYPRTLLLVALRQRNARDAIYQYFANMEKLRRELYEETIKPQYEDILSSFQSRD